MSARSTRDEIRVGALVVAATVILVAGLLWFKGCTALRDQREIVASFSSASGLLEGDPVEVHGVTAGEVESIRLTDRGARVRLRVDREVPIYADATANVENVGIMGQKRVAIDPGTADAGPFPSDSLITGEHQRSVTDAIGDMRSVATAIESLAVQLGAVVEPMGAETGSTLVRSLAHVEMASGRLAAHLDEEGEVVRTLRAARRMIAHTDSLVRSDGVHETLDRLARITARLDTTLARVDRISVRADSLLVGIENGRGTIGRLLTDEAFQDSLEVTLATARELIRDIRANPGRYVDVSIF